MNAAFDTGPPRRRATQPSSKRAGIGVENTTRLTPAENIRFSPYAQRSVLAPDQNPRKAQLLHGEL